MIENEKEYYLGNTDEQITTNVVWYLRGYWKALNEYGIWNNGVQRIGCLETPIKEVMIKKLKNMNLDESYLEKIIK